MEKERRILSDVILDSGHLPVQMESGFLGTNTDYSIDVDKRKIEEVDGVIFILSYLYGEEIGDKIGNKNLCPIKNNKNSDACVSFCHDPNSCGLSFTHFEYEYAKFLGKPIAVTWNQKYNSEEDFKKANNVCVQSGEADCTASFYVGRNKNDKFVQGATLFHAPSYSVETEFRSNCRKLVSSVVEEINKRERNGATDYGLIPYRDYYDAKSVAESINIKLQNFKKESIEDVFPHQNSAFAGGI